MYHIIKPIISKLKNLNKAKEVVLILNSSKQLREDYIEVKAKCIKQGIGTFPEYSDYKSKLFWSKFNQKYFSDHS